MNYRHAFHAGNFADVVKHAVLVRILVHLRGKPTPFRVLDLHAGAGRYALTGAEAMRTAEWRDGIGRLLAATPDPAAAALLAPYLDIVARDNVAGEPHVYPGSPSIVQALLRTQDRLTACELQPAAAAALAQTLGRDRRCKALAIDGWTALNAYIPFRERRGLVLIDPPFESPDEFARLPQRLAAAHRKWPDGIYLVWYPIKQRAAADSLAAALRRLGLPKLLRAELMVEPGEAAERLAGSGLVIVNPPWTLEAELAVLLPALAGILGRHGPGWQRQDWLRGEK